MPNIYKILRWGTQIKSRRIKLFGLWLFHVLGKRYIGIFLDPVLACNFRCRMCYFSDDEKRKTMRGSFSYEEIETIAQGLFHRALKLQIGCGAEPTLHKDLIRIIALGKQYKVPYISLTTNGNLLSREQLMEAAKNGLDELTLSAHGFTRTTYEYLMTNGKFELFQRLLTDVAEVKKTYPNFKLRINYTINNDNLDELVHIWDVVGNELDILQLRPIQKIGDSAYQDFDLTRIYAQYDSLIRPVIEECHRRNITCLVPDKQNITVLEESKNTDNSIEKLTYCYISPQGCWKEDYNFETDNFERYSARRHLGWKILKKVFGKETLQQSQVTRKMNYNIK